VSIKHDEKLGIYLLFSRLFREPPDERLLAEIVGKQLLTIIYDLEETQQEPGTLLEERRWCSNVEKIAVEYAALFVVPGEHSIIPYGSFYCDAVVIDTSTACSAYFPSESIREWGVKGLIAGPSANAAKKIYLQQGYRMEMEGYMLPDHIACELEFIGRMYREGKIDVAKTFFQNFLSPWVFFFLNKLKQQNYSKFYQNVAISLDKFLQQEFRDIFPVGTMVTSGCEKT